MLALIKTNNFCIELQRKNLIFCPHLFNCMEEGGQNFPVRVKSVPTTTVLRLPTKNLRLMVCTYGLIV